MLSYDDRIRVERQIVAKDRSLRPRTSPSVSNQVHPLLTMTPDSTLLAPLYFVPNKLNNTRRSAMQSFLARLGDICITSTSFHHSMVRAAKQVASHPLSASLSSSGLSGNPVGILSLLCSYLLVVETESFLVVVIPHFLQSPYKSVNSKLH
jgi:hypothetical protein